MTPVFRTTRAIAPGEELTLNYHEGHHYWSAEYVAGLLDKGRISVACW